MTPEQLQQLGKRLEVFGIGRNLNNTRRECPDAFGTVFHVNTTVEQLEHNSDDDSVFEALPQQIKTTLYKIFQDTSLEPELAIVNLRCNEKTQQVRQTVAELVKACETDNTIDKFNVMVIKTKEQIMAQMSKCSVTSDTQANIRKAVDILVKTRWDEFEAKQRLFDDCEKAFETNTTVPVDYNPNTSTNPQIQRLVQLTVCDPMQPSVLKTIIDAVVGTTNTATDILSRLPQDFDDCTEKLGRCVYELSLLKTQHVQSLKLIRQCLFELDRTPADLKGLVKQLDTEKKKCKLAAEAVEKLETEKKKMFTVAKEGIKKSHEEHAVLNEKNTKLQAQAAVLETEHAQLKSQVTHLEAQVVSLRQDEILQREISMKTLADAKKTKTELCENHNKKVAVLKTQIDELKQTNANLHTEVVSQSITLADAEQQLLTMQKAINLLQEECDKAVSDKECDKAELKQKIQKYKTDLTEVTAELTTTQLAKSKLADELIQTNAEVQAQHKLHVDKLEESNKQLQQQLDCANASVAEMNKRNAQLKERIAQLQTDTADTRQSQYVTNKCKPDSKIVSTTKSRQCFVEKTVHCLMHQIPDCSVKFQLTGSQYVGLANLDSDYDVLVHSNHVQILNEISKLIQEMHNGKVPEIAPIIQDSSPQPSWANMKVTLEHANTQLVIDITWKRLAPAVLQCANGLIQKVTPPPTKPYIETLVSRCNCLVNPEFKHFVVFAKKTNKLLNKQQQIQKRLVPSCFLCGVVFNYASGCSTDGVLCNNWNIKILQQMKSCTAETLTQFAQTQVQFGLELSFQDWGQLDKFAQRISQIAQNMLS